MKKNRILCYVLALVMCMSSLVACQKTEVVQKKSIVCTIFPEYDWVKEVLGEKQDEYEITLLLDNGVDLHNYQPTAADLAKIASCDLFIYVGGESDEWVEDALSEATNPNMQVLNLLDALGEAVKEEELVEGMEAEEEDEEEGDEEKVEYDEHVWLSLRNAQALVEQINEKVIALDPSNKATYQTNAENYVKKLSELDAEYQTVVQSAKQTTLLFGDRFPFRYLVDDYGLDYYAAFVGCSAETEASFDTITFLAGKMEELGLSHVMVIESSDQKIAETIMQSAQLSSTDILVMDSMQSTTMEDIQKGATYDQIMADNLEVLKTALQ